MNTQLEMTAAVAATPVFFEALAANRDTSPAEAWAKFREVQKQTDRHVIEAFLERRDEAW